MERKNHKKFSFRDRLKSFSYAFNGLKILFCEEHNARIHLIFAILACVLGFFLDISAVEWMVIIILIGLVFSLEIINSSIENICDFISPEWNEKIKQIKDLIAAAVLIMATLSVICGLIIFLPKLYILIQ